MASAEETVNISGLSLTEKAEIAAYIKADTLETVNRNVEPVRPMVSGYTKYGKRALDIVLGLAGFVVTAPINIVLAIATYIDVGSPIIFEQKRTGLNGREFTIYKFRNMTNDVDANGELLPAADRVTKWGKFVRKTSLDELLNFYSVLKGDMSIIGPRPLLDRYAERLNDRHRAIYKVRPGLECPTPSKDITINSVQDRLENYVWYVENCSPEVDAKLALRLVEQVFDRKSARARAKGENGGVLGYDFDGTLIGLKAVPKRYVDRFCEAHGFRDIDEAVAARMEK